MYNHAISASYRGSFKILTLIQVNKIQYWGCSTIFNILELNNLQKQKTNTMKSIDNNY